MFLATLRRLVVLGTGVVSLTPTPTKTKDVSRRGALEWTVAAPVIVATSAQATDVTKFNKKLAQIGISEIDGIPNGFNAVIESYAQSSPKLWVEFFYPNNWLLVRPSLNTNGESGTISAGDYGKGDSCALYVGSGGDLSKASLAKTIIAGISQRGDNQYQNFELGKVTPGPEKNYAIAEFTYELLTGAGFVVERRGVASVTTVGSTVPALIAVTTAARYKKISNLLTTSATSFRAYEKASNIDLTTTDDV